MEFAGLLLLAVYLACLVIFVVGLVQILAVAARRDFVWLLMCLVVPFALFVFVVMYWDDVSGIVVRMFKVWAIAVGIIAVFSMFS